MLVKNEYDRQGLLAIGRIVSLALEELCREAKPGVDTAALDDLARRLLELHGAEPTPSKEYNFPGRLCISVNNEVVHGIPGGRVLEQGDLIKLDLTADKRGFVADATRMALLDPAPAPARRLADAARRACRAAIAAAQPGVGLADLGAVIQEEAERDGFTIVRELCGHGVGRRTHEEPEVPNFQDWTNPGILREGMVITIEPILSAGSGSIRTLDDGWTVVTADGALAAHYEETIIVAPGGAEVVTTL